MEADEENNDEEKQTDHPALKFLQEKAAEATKQKNDPALKLLVVASKYILYFDY
jgi:hypothetical protein